MVIFPRDLCSQKIYRIVRKINIYKDNNYWIYLYTVSYPKCAIMISVINWFLCSQTKETFLAHKCCASSKNVYV